jgi:hypothetical protein
LGFRRLRQEELEFEASLGYIVKLHLGDKKKAGGDFVCV